MFRSFRAAPENNNFNKFWNAQNFFHDGTQLTSSRKRRAVGINLLNIDFPTDLSDELSEILATFIKFAVFYVNTKVKTKYRGHLKTNSV